MKNSRLLPAVNVSRETEDKLRAYQDLVLKWNPKVNLIARSTIGDLWERHIWDSVQLFPLLDGNEKNILDIGSGGGFPAIVLAVLLSESGYAPHYTLVESDKRKSAFLREAVRLLDLNCTVRAERIEALEPLNADLITARALASLDLLFEFAEPHSATNGRLIFPKGQTALDELKQAQNNWEFDFELFESQTSDQSLIIKVENLKRVA